MEMGDRKIEIGQDRNGEDERGNYVKGKEKWIGEREDSIGERPTEQR